MAQRGCCAHQELPFESAVVGGRELPEGVLDQVSSSQGELEDRGRRF